jgi:RecJ-like exonuclease
MRGRPRREFLISDDAQEQADQFGISESSLREMLRHSVRITHPNGNRRYEDFLFMVEGFMVLSMGRVTAGMKPAFTCEVCRDTGRMSVFNQCKECDGTGCDHCDQGLVPAAIPCPSCRKGRGKG